MECERCGEKVSVFEEVERKREMYRTVMGARNVLDEIDTNIRMVRTSQDIGEVRDVLESLQTYIQDAKHSYPLLNVE